jgi:hypothetical protein
MGKSEALPTTFIYTADSRFGKMRFANALYMADYVQPFECG